MENVRQLLQCWVVLLKHAVLPARDLKCGSVVDLSWQPGQLQSKREPLLPAIRGTLHQDPPLPRCAEARSPTGAAGL